MKACVERWEFGMIETHSIRHDILDILSAIMAEIDESLAYTFHFNFVLSVICCNDLNTDRLTPRYHLKHPVSP